MIKKIDIKDIEIFNNSILEDLEFILKQINNRNYRYQIEGFEYISKGCDGVVFKYKNYAIKLPINSDFFDCNDIVFYPLVKEISSYPTLYAGNKEILITEFIEGNIIANCNEEDFLLCKNDCLDIFFSDLKKVLDKNIGYYDLHDENIILNKEGYLKIVDVGCYSHISQSGKKRFLNTIENKPYDIIIENLFYGECESLFKKILKNVRTNMVNQIA